MSYSEYEADRDSLTRMLLEFEGDFLKRRGAGAAVALGAAGPEASSAAGSAKGMTAAPAPDAAAGAGPKGSGLPGMDLMMRSYEAELKKPLRNLVGGDLARALLIQVQKLKCDTESAMLEIDQLIRANELTISFVAAVPAFIIAGGALYGLSRWVGGGVWGWGDQAMPGLQGGRK